MRAGPAFEILLVEDNPGDVRLIEDALRAEDVPRRLHVVADGEAGLGFLRRQGPHAAAPRPDLILLDLNLPRRDGREVLAEIKQDPGLREIPVVVFTSSDLMTDVFECYRLQANCYVTKPADPDAFGATVRAVERFWLGVARVPRRHG